jgi:hypothetical protein
MIAIPISATGMFVGRLSVTHVLACLLLKLPALKVSAKERWGEDYAQSRSGDTVSFDEI